MSVRAPAGSSPERRAELELELEHLAFHDALTGLPNRALVERRLAEAVAAARDAGGEVALLFVDLNDFKLVNDSLGHAAGDAVLCEVARRLRGVMRSSDMLARQGGDEFLVVLDGAGAVAAAEASDRIRAVLVEPLRVDEAEFALDASVGVSVFPGDAADAAELARHADTAMYHAKRTGSGLALYESGGPDPLASLALAARLRRALARDELELHYQPVYRIESRALLGVEALLRWRDPSREGLVPPLEFIPAAERTGLIEPIGDFVFREVCRQAEEWLGAGLAPNFGVNVSPRQLRRPGAIEPFLRDLRVRGLDPSRFVLEVTESAWGMESSRILPVLAELRANGLPLAIDDFGAGYSSLARLRELPAQVIKIDRAFMRGVPDDAKANAVVRAIVQLADAYGCDVVAEGVETAEQLTFLAANGCRLAQGFHLGRPVPAEQVRAVLEAALDPARRVGVRAARARRGRR